MATAQADAEQRRRQAAALAAGGGQANLAGAQLGAKAAVAPPAAAVRAAAASAIIAGLVTFLAALRTRHREWLTRELAKRRPQAQPAVPEDIAAVLAEEDRREVAFAQASAARVASGLPSALAIGDPAERQAAIRGLLAKERNYARQHGQAMAERAFAALDRTALRRVSPAGAYWELNPRLDHCPQCVAMANRFWPWAVLDVIHPPVHLHCGCTLSSYLDAVARGVMRPSDVRPLGEAIELAAAIDALSDEQAAALLNEVALREALIERGVPASRLEGLPLVGLAEAFEEGKHPRGWGGRFKTVAQVAEEMTTRSLGWRARMGEGALKDAPPREQIVKNWTKQLRGTLSKDRGAIGLVAEAQRENAANELYQRIVAAHEPDHVVVTTPIPERSTSMVHSMHDRPHRVAGTTAIADKSVREIGLRGTGKSPADRPAASSGYGLAAVLRHEYGHSIDSLLPREQRRHILDAIPNPSEDLTYYAGMGDQEVIPELLATITHPDYKAEDWPATVQEAEKRLLAALGVAREAKR